MLSVVHHGINPQNRLETKFVFPGNEQNIEASGKLDPLLNQGVLDASRIPVDLNLKLASIVLDRLRPLADVGSKKPPGLSVWSFIRLL
jgi:hypothetical protein